MLVYKTISQALNICSSFQNYPDRLAHLHVQAGKGERWGQSRTPFWVNLSTIGGALCKASRYRNMTWRKPWEVLFAVCHKSQLRQNKTCGKNVLCQIRSALKFLTVKVNVWQKTTSMYHHEYTILMGKHGRDSIMLRVFFSRSSEVYKNW